MAGPSKTAALTLGHSVASFLADLLGLPDWAPRAARRAAALILAIAAVFYTSAFNEGIRLWAQHESRTYLNLIGPLLHPPTSQVPDQAPGKSVSSP